MSARKVVRMSMNLWPIEFVLNVNASINVSNHPDLVTVFRLHVWRLYNSIKPFNVSYCNTSIDIHSHTLSFSLSVSILSNSSFFSTEKKDKRMRIDATQSAQDCFVILIWCLSHVFKSVFHAFFLVFFWFRFVSYRGLVCSQLNSIFDSYAINMLPS